MITKKSFKNKKNSVKQFKQRSRTKPKRGLAKKFEIQKNTGEVKRTALDQLSICLSHFYPERPITHDKKGFNRESNRTLMKSLKSRNNVGK